jgi:MFS family permease
MSGVLLTFVIIGITHENFYWVGFTSRAVQGLFIGIISMVTPMYIIELTPKRYRGAFGSFPQLGTALGASYLTLLGIWLKWRLVSYLAAIIQALFCILIFFIPESPTVKRNRDLIVKESFFQRKYLYVFVHPFLLTLIQRFSGIEAILSTVDSIFNISSSLLSPAVTALSITVTRIISVAWGAAVVQKLGRRLALIISAIGQMTGLILAFANAYWEIGDFFPVVPFFLTVVSHDLGINPVPAIVTAELFPDAVRSIACSFAAGFNWLLSSAMLLIFPVMIQNLGIDWVFLIFAVCSGMALLYGVRWMPETRERNLGEFGRSEEGPNAIEAVQLEFISEDAQSPQPNVTLGELASDGLGLLDDGG